MSFFFKDPHGKRARAARSLSGIAGALALVFIGFSRARFYVCVAPGMKSFSGFGNAFQCKNLSVIFGENDELSKMADPLLLRFRWRGALSGAGLRCSGIAHSLASKEQVNGLPCASETALCNDQSNLLPLVLGQVIGVFGAVLASFQTSRIGQS